MPGTPERSRGESSTEGIQLEDRPAGEEPVDVGEVRLVEGEILARDSIGNFNLRSAGGGISEETHRLLDQWVHFDVDEDCVYEVLPPLNRPTGEVWWTDETKTQKIRDVVYSWDGAKVLSETRRSYDAGGVLVETLTITYTYVGSRPSGATYVRS